MEPSPETSHDAHVSAATGQAAAVFQEDRQKVRLVDPASAPSPAELQQRFSVLRALVDPAAPNLSLWVKDLLGRHLDAPSRASLRCANWATRLWLLGLPQRPTITLVAYGGLSEAAWRRRLQLAEQTLARHGESMPARTALVVRLPTPNDAALHSLLGLREPSGSVVTQLDIHQLRQSDWGWRPGPLDTSWLSMCMYAFPNLSALRLNIVCGSLPAPYLAPHLRELSMGVSRCPEPYVDELEIMSLGIGALVPQLFILKVREKPGANLAWDLIFPTSTTNTALTTVVGITTYPLREFGTSGRLTGAILRGLLQLAPSLRSVSCGHLEWGFSSGEHEHATWGVESLQSTWRAQYSSGWFTARELAKLPQSPNGLWLQTRRGLPCVEFEADQEGLCETVSRRMAQWRIAAPGEVVLLISKHSDTYPAAPGIMAALQQLASCPGVTTVQLRYSSATYHAPTLAAAAAAIAAAVQSLPHLTVVAPYAPSDEDGVAALLRLQPPVAHASLQPVRAPLAPPPPSAHAQTPWPWQSLRAEGQFELYEVTRLPDPSDGLFELWVETMHLNRKYVPENTAELTRRMQHLKFMCSDIVCEPNYTLGPGPSFFNGEHTPPAEQPTELQHKLEVLRGMQLKPKPGTTAFTITLTLWTITPAFIDTLQYLPEFPWPARLCLCIGWVPEDLDMSSLCPRVPACYTEYWLRVSGEGQETVQGLVALCRGAAGRPNTSQPLKLYITESDQFMCSEALRSGVEQGIHEQGLHTHVEIIWDVDQAVASSAQRS